MAYATDAALFSDIKAAITKSRQDGAKKGADPDAIIATLSQDIGNGVHSFALTGQVTTTYNIDGNVVVVGFLGPPPASAPVPAFTSSATGDAQGVLT